MKIKTKQEIIDILVQQLDNARNLYAREKLAYDDTPYADSFRHRRLIVAEANLIQIECICTVAGIIKEGTI